MYKVIIIDDEHWSREVVKSLVDWEKQGLEVVGEAEDGTKGLKLIIEFKPDIIITDMRMPGLDGTELLKSMNEINPNLKIVVMSGYDDFVYLRQAIQSKAMDYLVKPIDADDLTSVLEKCVSELDVTSKRMKPLVLKADLFNQYTLYKERIYGSLWELNKQEVKDTFMKLDGLLVDLNVEQVVAKLEHDFVSFLDQFIVEKGMNVESNNILGNGVLSITEMTTILSELYNKAICAVESDRKSRSQLDLAEVKTHLDLHFQGDITLESVANQFLVTKEHLSRAFKLHTGVPLMEYIVMKRMEKAKELIVDQQLAIKTAAQMTGYDDISYFYKVFKKHFGLTPKELVNESIR